MTRYTFEEITRKVTRRVPCRVCGVKLTRSETLSQTVNPFNKDDDGNPKTEQQIVAELKTQAETWHPWNDIHEKCIATEVAAKLAAAEQATS
jgi:transcriptional regulator NrdR family protein